jgi:hypothetical protein
LERFLHGGDLRAGDAQHAGHVGAGALQLRAHAMQRCQCGCWQRRGGGGGGGGRRIIKIGGRWSGGGRFGSKRCTCRHA